MCVQVYTVRGDFQPANQLLHEELFVGLKRFNAFQICSSISFKIVQLFTTMQIISRYIRLVNVATDRRTDGLGSPFGTDQEYIHICELYLGKPTAVPVVLIMLASCDLTLYKTMLQSELSPSVHCKHQDNTNKPTERVSGSYIKIFPITLVTT